MAVGVMSSLDDGFPPETAHHLKKTLDPIDCKNGNVESRVDCQVGLDIHEPGRKPDSTVHEEEVEEIIKQVVVLVCDEGLSEIVEVKTQGNRIGERTPKNGYRTLHLFCSFLFDTTKQPSARRSLSVRHERPFSSIIQIIVFGLLLDVPLGGCLPLYNCLDEGQSPLVALSEIISFNQTNQTNMSKVLADNITIARPLVLEVLEIIDSPFMWWDYDVEEHSELSIMIRVSLAAYLELLFTIDCIHFTNNLGPSTSNGTRTNKRAAEDPPCHQEPKKTGVLSHENDEEDPIWPRDPIWTRGYKNKGGYLLIPVINNTNGRNDVSDLIKGPIQDIPVLRILPEDRAAISCNRLSDECELSFLNTNWTLPEDRAAKSCNCLGAGQSPSVYLSERIPYNQTITNLTIRPGEMVHLNCKVNVSVRLDWNNTQVLIHCSTDLCHPAFPHVLNRENGTMTFNITENETSVYQCTTSHVGRQIFNIFVVAVPSSGPEVNWNPQDCICGSHRDLTVYWQDIPENHKNGEITYFTVSLTPLGGGDVIVESDIAYRVRQKSFLGQRVRCDTDYAVSVIAYTVIGPSPMNSYPVQIAKYGTDMHLSIYTDGVECELSCDLNLELNGTNTMSCERNGTSGVRVWKWNGPAEPHCNIVSYPSLLPPADGAMTYDSINSRPLYVMLCQSGFDIPVVGLSFTGRLSCQDSGKWYPLDKFPDCIRPTWGDMVLLAERIYQGNCAHETTKNAIKEAVLKHLSEIEDDIERSICPGCRVENINVVCGSNQKRRSTVYIQRLAKRQTTYARVTLDIATLFDLSNTSSQEAFNILLPFLTAISDRIAKDEENGSLDINGFTLERGAYQRSNNTHLKCPLHYKRDGNKCKPCPKGTYMNSTTGNCELCNIGEYNEDDGKAQCNLCPANHNTLRKGSTRRENCTKLCDPGYASFTTMIPCSACPLGTYQPSSGKSACISCPKGHITQSTNSTSADSCTLFDIKKNNLNGLQMIGIAKSNMSSSMMSLSLWAKKNAATLEDLILAVYDGFNDKLTIRMGGLISLHTARNLSERKWSKLNVELNFSANVLTVNADGEKHETQVGMTSSSLVPWRLYMSATKNTDVSDVIKLPILDGYYITWTLHENRKAKSCNSLSDEFKAPNLYRNWTLLEPRTTKSCNCLSDEFKAPNLYTNWTLLEPRTTKSCNCLSDEFKAPNLYTNWTLLENRTAHSCNSISDEFKVPNLNMNDSSIDPEMYYEAIMLLIILVLEICASPVQIQKQSKTKICRIVPVIPLTFAFNWFNVNESYLDCEKHNCRKFDVLIMCVLLAICVYLEHTKAQRNAEEKWRRYQPAKEYIASFKQWSQQNMILCHPSNMELCCNPVKFVTATSYNVQGSAWPPHRTMLQWGIAEQGSHFEGFNKVDLRSQTIEDADGSLNETSELWVPYDGFYTSYEDVKMKKSSEGMQCMWNNSCEKCFCLTDKQTLKKQGSPNEMPGRRYTKRTREEDFLHHQYFENTQYHLMAPANFEVSMKIDSPNLQHSMNCHNAEQSQLKPEASRWTNAQLASELFQSQDRGSSAEMNFNADSETFQRGKYLKMNVVPSPSVFLAQQPPFRKGHLEEKNESDKPSFTGKVEKSVLRDAAWLPSDQLPRPKLDTVPVYYSYDQFDPLSFIISQIAEGKSPRPQVTMRYELLRICTLRTYPKENKPFLLKYAAAGFYYASDGDGVVCYCCGIRRYGWVEVDDPMEVHKRINPRCKFIINNSEHNVPATADGPLRQTVSRLEDMIPDCIRASSPGEDVNNSQRTRTGVQMAIPKHPHMAIKTVREQSFNGNWPNTPKYSPVQLADGGFFFTDLGDCVRCFFCGIGLRHWDKDDDMWVEHARWSQNCTFLIQKKGQNFVDLVQLAVSNLDDSDQSSNALYKNLVSEAAQKVLDQFEYTPQQIKEAIVAMLAIDSNTVVTEATLKLKIAEELNAGTYTKLSLEVRNTADPPVANSLAHSEPSNSAAHDPEDIKQENEQLKEQTLCKVCLDNIVSIVFLPCGHLVTCADCAPALRKCPICRADVKGTVRTRMS